MTKTELLDLPNELFPLIFQYLNSKNLIQTFFNVQSNRIQILIQPFISHLDISQETNQWIQTYLPDILNQQNVLALRLHAKQITLILPYVLLSKIQSMHIFDSHWSTDTLKQGLDQFGQRLKRLSITFTDPYGQGDLASHLFQRYCQLEYVNITGRSLFFGTNEISTCTKLTYLSVELEGMHRVFILMQNLPNLQQLKVKFRIEERMIQPTCYFKNLISCNTLQRITFTGCTRYFEHLSHFFATFGSTIQCLTINIDLMYNAIDGVRLERELLNKMQCLASFDLIIHSILAHRESIGINTFQTLSWRKFNPIVYWNDIHAHQHTIFTLPYRSNTFKHLSNDFHSSCASNREVFLYFERVRTLSLLVTTPLTLETFEFIAKSFPNIKTLELTNPIELSRGELKQNRTISLLSDVFLSNNTLQLPSIVKFCFLLRSHFDNYQILRRFLHLLPNLVYLQMFIGRSLFHEILKYEREDNFVRSALNRIETLQTVNFYDEKNILTNEETHNLFPNAKKLFHGGDTEVIKSNATSHQHVIVLPNKITVVFVMTSKTLLFDLPNELFPCIFQYLSAIDLLKIFADDKSHRLQTLIRPFISRLDISRESDEWVQNHLSNVLTQHEIVHLRLQSNHLTLIEKHLSANNIQSMQMVEFDASNDNQKQMLDRFGGKLKRLSFVQPEPHEYDNLASLLFRSDSQLERLTLLDYPLYFSVDDIEPCTRLTHLSIVLEGMSSVFLLIQHLPNLQNLKVTMFSQECIVQTPPDIKDVKPCSKLRSVTFKGWIKYFDHIESFFATFGSTIEYLSMDIDCRYYVFNGKKLEHVLLDKMPCLSSLDLIIFSPLANEDSIEIETFKSFSWQKFNPIVYWHDVHAQQHMIFTLPYKSDRFEYFSNEFVSTCVSSQTVSLCFDRVRTLILTNTTPFNFETFLFIEKVFPKVETIKLTHWIIDLLDEDEHENEDHQNVAVMNDDVLADTSLQIPSVKELRIDLSSPFKDYKAFRRFLQIFPNLISLKFQTEQSLLHDILQHEQEDKFIKTALARIEQLDIAFEDEKKPWTDAEIRQLFPKVKNIVKQYTREFGGA
ncbi:unnamed protein product [Rotaria socialis]|uniref:F-box domain-containing protein n=3 Tax=Rotaria socialis TaxID=392032 RepID=A0A820W157_9BILA|nr:unnamed protein product [Rotaria socialis]